MPATRFHNLLQHVSRVISPPRKTEASDAQLLEQFVSHKDEGAFELLVWRHGPLVLSVCRRVLGDLHSAEDAFQATFLTLVRKAGTIGNRTSLNSWLYKVAYRIALRARAREARYALCEQPLSGLTATETAMAPPEAAAWRELRGVLDAEVHRLPEKYRAPFILCYLEGKTNEQAAEELGCPKGTVLSRLARARERLRNRLTRRGLTLAALPVAALLTEHGDSLARMSPVLVNGTVHMSLLLLLHKFQSAAEAAIPAVGLMKGMVAEMTGGRSKARALVAVAIFFLFLAGGGLWAFHTRAVAPPASPPRSAPPPEPASLAPPTDFTPGGCGSVPDGDGH